MFPFEFDLSLRLLAVNTASLRLKVSILSLDCKCCLSPHDQPHEFHHFVDIYRGSVNFESLKHHILKHNEVEVSPAESDDGSAVDEILDTIHRPKHHRVHIDLDVSFE